MKGLILLFLAVAALLIGWRYMDKSSKRTVKNVVSQNIGAILLASLAVAAAIFLSINTTLRLV